jgi:hypothetical protein
MSIELGSLQLTKVHHIQTLEESGFIYQNIAGTAGEVVQDLGRAVVRLAISGIFYGDERLQQIASLRDIHLQRQPVDFIADTIDQTYASQVIIESLTVEEHARYPQQLSFQMVVREYIRSSAQSSVMDTQSIHNNIKAKAQNIMKVNSLMDGMATGSIPEITNPIAPLNSAMAPIAEAGAGLSATMTALNKIL